MADEVKRDIDPILSVFGGEDGGISFVKLRSFLTAAYLKTDKTPQEEALIAVVKRFSRLCQFALDGNL